jgi:hypothetical protein
MGVLETHSAALNRTRVKRLMDKPIPLETLMRFVSRRHIMMCLYYSKSDSTQSDPMASSKQSDKA